MKTQERIFDGFMISGFLALFLSIIVLGVSIWGITTGLLWALPLGFLGGILVFICTIGFIVVEPNNARVMIFFGKYRGTITKNGFFWVNPFYSKKKLTLRARNLDVPPIKVNDKVGNPIMIGSVLVWRVKDTYKAMFDIDTSSISGIAPGNN